MIVNVFQGFDRNNNHVESWHGAVSGSLRIQHPNIWKFLDFLKSEQGSVERKIVQMKAGANGPPKKKRSIDYEARLKKLVDGFDEAKAVTDEYFIDYLQRIAHNTIYANVN